MQNFILRAEYAGHQDIHLQFSTAATGKLPFSLLYKCKAKVCSRDNDCLLGKA